MAGLLGDTWGDPQTQAALSMAAGLLGGGNFGQALGRGLGGYQQSMAAGREQRIQDEELAMKKAAFASSEDQRKMKADFSKRLSSMLDGGSTGGDVGESGISGSGFNSSIADPKFQLAAKLAGYDLTDVAKLAQPNWQNINGNLVDTNAQGFKGGFQPGIHITPNGQAVLTMPGAGGVPIVGAAPGSLETVGAFQRQEQEIKNAGTLLPTSYVDAGSGQPIGGSIAGYLAQQQIPTQSKPATAIGGNTYNISQSVRDLIERDAQANGIQNPVANFTTRPGEMVDLVAQPAQRTGVSAPQVGKLQSQAQAKAAEAQAVIAPKAQEEINTTWLTNSYKPTVQAGESANSLLANVDMARSSLANIGKTGWGTEARATAASVLSALGVAPKGAEMFATNVQTFQNAAMSNLKTQLDAASGPQTEGDAERAGKLFASLSNSQQANTVILDMIEARAARDAAKARFYQAALPIAQRTGDLAAVDREWAARAPSVFDMPSMRKYGGKK